MMVRVFLDIDIGDPATSKEESEAYKRTLQYLKDVGHKQLGLDASTPDELDEEGDSRQSFLLALNFR